MEKKSAFVQEIYTECEINAPACKVYSVISDFANYNMWTNEIRISGDTQPGGKMHVDVKTANNGNGWFKLSSKMEKNNERIIAFDNALSAPFFFLGKHRFEMIPLSEDKTKFINAEEFSGFAVPFVRKKNLLQNTRRFKENVNSALKKRVEALEMEKKSTFLQEIYTACERNDPKMNITIVMDYYSLSEPQKMQFKQVIMEGLRGKFLNTLQNDTNSILSIIDIWIKYGFLPMDKNF
jgi:hypothetical protein